MEFEATTVQTPVGQIVLLPVSISQQFPSRGLVMAQGTIDGRPIQTALEPDGRGSHWFTADTPPGTVVTVSLEPLTAWTEPDVPQDLQQALNHDQTAYDVWQDITPMARWDWIRWIRATNNADTRKKRISVAFDKMHKGSRRPCCFNRSMCTVPEVSKNGLLVVR